MTRPLGNDCDRSDRRPLGEPRLRWPIMLLPLAMVVGLLVVAVTVASADEKQPAGQAAAVAAPAATTASMPVAPAATQAPAAPLAVPTPVSAPSAAPASAPAATPAAVPLPAKVPPPAAVPEPPRPLLPPADGSLADSPMSRQRLGGWVAVGVAVALGTGAGMFAIAAKSREDEVRRLTSFREPKTGEPLEYATVESQYRSLVDEGDRYRTLAIVFIGAATVAMGTATALFVLDHLRARREASRVLGSRRIRIAPSIGRGMAGIDAGWEF